jgi:DNA-binding cell septation regulator SpoVG
MTAQTRPAISEVSITPIKPQNGLVAFASFVLDDALYCGSIGIMTRPSGGFRLVYPTKLVAGRQLHLFHPIAASLGKQLEDVVITQYEEVMNHGRHRHSNFDTQE